MNGTKQLLFIALAASTYTFCAKIVETPADKTLLTAVKNKNLRGVTLALKEGANVNYAPTMGFTPLMNAVLTGELPLVEALLKAHADVNRQDFEWGNTALIEAAKKGNNAIVQALIAAHAIIDLKNRDGETALFYASKNGHKQCVAILKKSLANKNLMQALEDGNSADVRKALKDGANADYTLAMGITPLMIAAQKGDASIVQMLINAKAALNKQDFEWGDTALIKAARQGHLMVIKTLIKAKADLSLKDRYGHTAYDYALSNDYHKCATTLKHAIDKKTSPLKKKQPLKKLKG